MALVHCKECGKDMSSEAKSCPSCGAPPPKTTSTATIVVGGFFTLFVVSWVYNATNSASTAGMSKPPPTPEEVQKEKNFQTVVAGARWIKKNMKNPASFELVSAGMVGNSAACYEYRGKNSFNAVVPNYRVITESVNSGDAKDWNKYCAKKPMTDFTYARQAL